MTNKKDLQPSIDTGCSKETIATSLDQVLPVEGDQPDSPPLPPSAETERTRIAAILGAPEAEGRQGLARHLALETALSVDEAIGVMKVSPPESRRGRLRAEMAKVPNPEVGLGPIQPTRDPRQRVRDAARRIVESAK